MILTKVLSGDVFSCDEAGWLIGCSLHKLDKGIVDILLPCEPSAEEMGDGLQCIV